MKDVTHTFFAIYKQVAVNIKWPLGQNSKVWSLVLLLPFLLQAQAQTFCTGSGINVTIKGFCSNTHGALKYTAMDSAHDGLTNYEGVMGNSITINWNVSIMNPNIAGAHSEQKWNPVHGLDYESVVLNTNKAITSEVKDGASKRIKSI